mgnify:CR=1 FL=1
MTFGDGEINFANTEFSSGKYDDEDLAYDHYPYGSIRWMSGLEGFVGLFLMSYFTVVFVRKILR